MMDHNRATRIAGEMREEAAHVRKLAANCKTDGARDYLLNKAETIEGRAEGIWPTDRMAQ